jgi:hypothetical protein
LSAKRTSERGKQAFDRGELSELAQVRGCKRSVLWKC